MSIVTIIIALVVIFLAFRFIAGALKFVVILVVLALAAWLLFGGAAVAGVPIGDASGINMETLDAR